MAELKTRPTGADVAVFLDTVPEPRRQDCLAIAALMERITGAAPRMWGPSIIGFGDHHYVYASGREGDWFRLGFSPRKNDLTIYTMCGLDGAEDLLERLGRHKTGKACLYVKRLSDVDAGVLEALLRRSVERLV